MKRYFWMTLSCLLLGLSVWAQDQVVTFTAIEAEGPLIIELEQSSVHQVTRIEHAANVTWTVSNGVLKIQGEKDGTKAPKIRIEASQLNRLALQGAIILNSDDTFTAGEFALAIDQQCIVEMELEAGSIALAANSQSIVSLRGNSGLIKVNADNQSIVNLKKLRCGTLDVNADHQSIVEYRTGGDVQVNSRANRQSIISGE